MADGSSGDRWGGDHLPSKWDLLRTAVEAGHVLGGINIPYPGAHYHAAELIEEFLLETVPILDGTAVAWKPTPLARQIVKND